MKKLISLLLAFVMVLSLATVAFAADGDGEGSTPPSANSSIITGTSANNKGSITINKYNKENVYSLYRMLELESFSTEGQGNYSYKVIEDWREFFTTGFGKDYVTVDGNYVTKKETFTDTVAPEFAKEALEYAESKGIKPIKSSDNANANTDPVTGFPYYTFTDLELGYYLVDSTMGALCGLTTTNLHASINAKNGEPTLDKQVKEDSTNQWGGSNTASVGDTVEYRTTITVQAGAQKYVFHDKMSSGLTFDKVTSITYDGSPVTADGNYEVHTNCTVSGCACAKCPNDCTFHIIFSDTFCNTLSAGKALIIYYQATLNENAITVDHDGSTNEAKLEFGEEHFTEPDTVTTKFYDFDLVKTDGQNFLLDGAKFKLYVKTGTDAQGKDVFKQVPLTKITNADGTFYYRPAVATEIDEPAKLETALGEFEVEGGIIRFQGFDPDDYYFEETEAPEGYNKLTEKVKFTLTNSDKNAIFNEGIYSSGSGFHITNNSGTMLPETGATGTTMFIFFGMFVMLTTGVLLVTKKRMSMIEE